MIRLELSRIGDATVVEDRVIGTLDHHRVNVDTAAVRSRVRGVNPANVSGQRVEVRRRAQPLSAFESAERAVGLPAIATRLQRERNQLPGRAAVGGCLDGSAANTNRAFASMNFCISQAEPARSIPGRGRVIQVLPRNFCANSRSAATGLRLGPRAFSNFSSAMRASSAAGDLK